MEGFYAGEQCGQVCLLERSVYLLCIAWIRRHKAGNRKAKQKANTRAFEGEGKDLNQGSHSGDGEEGAEWEIL